MGRSWTGRRCLFVTRVSGSRRVPRPPARMTPFMTAGLCRKDPGLSIARCAEELLVLPLHLRQTDAVRKRGESHVAREPVLVARPGRQVSRPREELPSLQAPQDGDVLQRDLSGEE